MNCLPKFHTQWVDHDFVTDWPRVEDSHHEPPQPPCKECWNHHLISLENVNILKDKNHEPLVIRWMVVDNDNKIVNSTRWITFYEVLDFQMVDIYLPFHFFNIFFNLDECVIVVFYRRNLCNNCCLRIPDSVNDCISIWSKQCLNSWPEVVWIFFILWRDNCLFRPEWRIYLYDHRSHTIDHQWIHYFISFLWHEEVTIIRIDLMNNVISKWPFWEVHWVNNCYRQIIGSLRIRYLDNTTNQKFVVWIKVHNDVHVDDQIDLISQWMNLVAHDQYITHLNNCTSLPCLQRCVISKEHTIVSISRVIVISSFVVLLIFWLLFCRDSLF